MTLNIDFTPLWKTPSQTAAVEVLVTCRRWTDALVAEAGSKERTAPTALGDGSWSIKDLLGHLATHEHRALLVLGARTPSAADKASFADVAAFNAHHLAKKRRWSLEKVESDYARTRDELVSAINATSDDRWREKIAVGNGRSALGLVLGKMLNGDKYGYFAHDLAHGRGLQQAIESLRNRRS